MPAVSRCSSASSRRASSSSPTCRGRCRSCTEWTSSSSRAMTVRARAASAPSRLLKDLDEDIAGRDVLLVEDVVDTGLTLHALTRILELREPRSLAAVTLLDRPYRRLVEDLPVRYSGFTVPDEFFVGYGFDLDERYRNLPDLHLYRTR